MNSAITLKANEIDCRINTINEKGLTLLLYKDARVDQNILLNEKLRDEYSFTRTLKLACNLDYNDIRYIIASEINDDFIPFSKFK